MAKPTYFGAPPKKGFKPPVYTGKKSENTSKRIDGVAMSVSLSKDALEWREELKIWQDKIKAIDDKIDMSGKSIKEMMIIFDNLSSGKKEELDENDKIDEKDEKRIRDAVLTL